jgi:formylglycine-generating enzyme required for sulfatase activity
MMDSTRMTKHLFITAVVASCLLYAQQPAPEAKPAQPAPEAKPAADAKNAAKPAEGKPFDLELPNKGGAITMRWCPPGSFNMGSPKEESGSSEEEPLHKVTISRGFWIAETETTQNQWQAVRGVTQEQQLKRTNRFGELTSVGPDVPIYHVSYHEALDFCKRLTDAERKAGRLPAGYVFTLPTEAQWEYACRAGTTTALNSGKDLTDKLRCPNADEVAWFRGNSYISNDTQPPGPHPVAKKRANAWGLFDMHGNIAEWCLDKAVFDYEDNLIITLGETTADPMNKKGTEAVVRGGSWASPATMCRSASRRCQPLKTRGTHLGFRIVLIKQ